MADDDTDQSESALEDDVITDSDLRTDQARPDQPKVYGSVEEALKSKPEPVNKDPGETAPELPESMQSKGELSAEEMKKGYELDESVKKTNEAREALRHLHSITDPMWARYRAMTQQDMQQRQEMDQQLRAQADAQAQAMPQREKQTWLGVASQLFVTAAAIGLAFGMRGNGFAKGAAMSALGAAMKGFADGRKEAAKEHMQAYREQVAAINKSNAQRHQIYRDILANKKLELEDQFKMIHSVAQEFGDPYMAGASRRRSMADVNKQLENQKKVANRFAKNARKAGDAVEGKPADWVEYVEYMKAYEHIDPNKDRAAADAKYPYGKWKNEQSTAEDRKRTAKNKAKEEEEPSPDDIRSRIIDNQ